MPSADLNTEWGSSYRLNAAEKWRAKSARMGRDVTEALVDYTRPDAGMNILDVASGTGEPAITIASRVGGSGPITATDLNADLPAIAAHFDLATCRFGVMFFPDVQRALRELLRVLRPGARACFAAWGPREQPYFSASIGIVHRHMGGPLIVSGGPDPFRFADAGSLSRALNEAGFASVHEETRIVPWTWPGTLEEVWEQLQAVVAPFRALLDRVLAIDWPKLNEEIHSAIGKYQDGNEVKFIATIVLASGYKP